MSQITLITEERRNEEMRATELIGFFVWPLVEGSNTVALDRERGCAGKVCRPRLFVRILHLLAFLMWRLPYEEAIGLRRAGYLREIASFVLLHFTGRRDAVASFVGIEWQNGKPVFVTEFIEGRQPAPKEVATYQDKVTDYFTRAGLPTWEICTSNPRGYTNFILREGDGAPVIIDLESLILNVFVSLEEWSDAIRAGNVPPFDDICFPKLWVFFHEVKGGLDENGARRFEICIRRCQQLTREMRRNEPRIWARLLSPLLRRWEG